MAHRSYPSRERALRALLRRRPLTYEEGTYRLSTRPRVVSGGR
ncbi:hypothetical protein [Streptomyces europaeiscabiei]|nr:hypothetical protein [Streptomyces europaeiscabiei]MDX2528074.1 hypothetical protein [Streptomyces europaeiscabiei]